MLVEKRMKRDPVTVTPDDSFRHAMTLIRQKGIRHLPVVEGGQLVGIVTDRDIRQTSPSPATSLEIHELHYLLEKVRIREIMTKKVYTVTPDIPIEEAARLMLQYKIGGLPVLKQGTLVGIITETDILRAFVEVMGIQQEQTRLELAPIRNYQPPRRQERQDRISSLGETNQASEGPTNAFSRSWIGRSKHRIFGDLGVMAVQSFSRIRVSPGGPARRLPGGLPDHPGAGR